MEKKIVFIVLLITLIFSQISLGQNAWINEFHYDNSVGDVGEFIEVAIENAGSYVLSDFRISLYNGANGYRYGSYHDLSTFTEGVTENNITLYYKNISGLQNDLDGIALDYTATLIQFLSYEGSFLANDGPAIGETSTDIGVSESGTTAIGESLQLRGTGTQYNNYVWFPPDAETKGTSNNSQALPVELTSFAANATNGGVLLNWSTAIEVNNYGFEIEASAIGTHLGTTLSQHSEAEGNRSWETIGFVAGHGNSNSPKEYTYFDPMVSEQSRSYRLKQIDTDGNFEYFPNAFGITVTGSLTKTELFQNHPNPFNPSTKISFALDRESEVNISIYNMLGQKVAELVNSKMNAGTHKVEFNASHLSSGFYIYRLVTDSYGETASYSKTMKMILLK